MKLLKIIGILILTTLYACGGGNSKSPAPPTPGDQTPPPGNQTPPPENQNPGKEEKLYFEKQTDANCTLHSVNNAFGGSFLSSEDYDRYINLTVAQKTGDIPDDGFYLGGLFLGQHRFTAAQQQALRRYYDPNTPDDLETKRAVLAQEFDAHQDQDPDAALNWQTFSQDMGLFGGAKNFHFVLPIVNQLYDLKLNLTHYDRDLKSELARLSQDFMNAERLILTTSAQGGHFFALRKFNGIWYKLESGDSGPEQLSGSHLDWLRTQAPVGARVKYFTADEEAGINVAAKNLNKTPRP